MNIIKEIINIMVAIYVALIIKGKKTFNDVPVRLRDKVKEMLIDLDLEDFVNHE